MVQLTGKEQQVRVLTASLEGALASSRLAEQRAAASLRRRGAEVQARLYGNVINLYGDMINLYTI